MTEEKEVVPESNGEEDKEEKTNGKESITEQSNVDEDKGKENIDEELIDLEAEIIRQVEYYFGDVNLPRDKFLREQTELDDGWVPIEVLLKFNRLCKLSSSVDVIENALNKSTSGLLEIADKKVRRNPEQPVPEMNENRRKDILKRTIYAKGFPKDTSLDEILRFLKKYDAVENVIMRRYTDPRTRARLFKGSIFVSFKTREKAEKFMETKDSCNFKGNDLLVMWQEEYLIVKQEEKTDRQMKKEKKKQKEEKSSSGFSLPTGTVLYFEDGHDKMTREEIKSALNEIDKNNEIAFIDFKIGLTKGWIRFVKENAAVEFFKLLSEGALVIGDHKVVVRVLEGDEEKEYLEKTVNEMSKRRKNMKIFKYKGKNNYQGKHHMKRRRDNDAEDGPPAKTKCDS